MKKNIVKILAIGMLLGGAVIPTTVANNGTLSQITTTQTAKAATTDEQAQTVSYKVLKTNSDSSSISSKYFTKTAKVTPNGDGTYKVTLTVEIPAIASVDIQTMGGKTVTDSETYAKDGKNYKDVSFNIDSLDALKGKLNSSMQIKVLGIGLMKPTADFEFDTSSLKAVAPDTTKDPAKTPDTTTDSSTPLIPDPNATTTTPSTSADNEGTSVVIGTPVTTPSTQASSTEQDIPYQVLKADASQGESVSTQFFTGTSKVTKNDDGTYKVMMTMIYPTSFGTQPVTINSINGESINPEDTKTYTQDPNNYMDFSFNIKSLSDLDSLIPCSMTIDVPDYGFDSTESVNFKFNATSSGVAGTSTVGNSASGTTGTGSGTYGSTSAWPSSDSATTPSSSTTGNSTLPQTSNASNTILLSTIGLAVASLSIVLFKKTYGMKA